LNLIPDNIIEDLKSKLLTVKNIVITTHANPDGDAIGSSLGLYHCLKNKGFNVDVVTPNGYPEFLQWMDDNDKVVKFSDNKKEAKLLIDKADIIFCLDFNSLDRTGDLEDTLKFALASKVLIDHHPMPEDFAEITISDTSVSSTAELVYNVIEKLSFETYVDKSSAEALYAGIMTDTGCFSYNSSNPNTFRVVSELLRIGIDKDKVYGKVFYNFSAERMRLMGYSLNDKMVVIPELKTAYIAITEAELEKYNFQPGDTEGLVNLPLSIKGIVFSAIFIEKPDQVKISFRSKGSFDTNIFARENFNGGGHVNASGGNSKLSFTDAINKFEQLLPNYSDKLNK
jgi:phosphoesterase RecJ-like protein